MLISLLSNDSVQVKTKTSSMAIGNGVTIGTYSIPGAGEYDIAGIQCEAVYADTALCYYMRAEDLQITFVDGPDLSMAKQDEASRTDILIIDLRSDTEVSTVKSLIKSVEPSYIALIGAGVTADFLSGLALPHQASPLKLTRSSLPIEGSYLLVQN
jgi:hypothetical protein